MLKNPHYPIRRIELCCSVNLRWKLFYRIGSWSPRKPLLGLGSHKRQDEKKKHLKGENLNLLLGVKLRWKICFNTNKPQIDFHVCRNVLSRFLENKAAKISSRGIFLMDTYHWKCRTSNSTLLYPLANCTSKITMRLYNSMQMSIRHKVSMYCSPKITKSQKFNILYFWHYCQWPVFFLFADSYYFRELLVPWFFRTPLIFLVTSWDQELTEANHSCLIWQCFVSPVAILQEWAELCVTCLPQ